MTGCGEYGAEGLDNLHVMKTRYPEAWLEPDEEGHWYPDKAEQGQIALVHHAQHVEIIIDFPLYRPLRHPVIIHIAELGNQDVIHHDK